MTATEFMAWWGGAVATLVLGWDIYKWKRLGPQVKVTASPNMEEFGLGANPSRKVVLIVATNRGDRPTTVTKCVGLWYPSTWRWLLRRRGVASIILNRGSVGPALPHVLNPGGVWTGGADQRDFEDRGRHAKGWLFVGVQHSCASRPVLTRVRFRRR